MNKYLILTLLSSFSLFCYCYIHKKNIDDIKLYQVLDKVLEYCNGKLHNVS